MNQKLRFLLASLHKNLLNKDMTCPSCGYEESEVCDRKHAIMSLRRCGRCKLLFRAPTTSDKENRDYYQDSYKIGFTTEMPTSDKLQELLETRFIDTERDHSDKIDVLKALGSQPGDKLLDFGCSWGYGSWQLTQSGFDVTSFEISEPRADYAHEQLGVDVLTSMDALKSDPKLEGHFDVFFSSHVLEHVPSPAAVFDVAFRILKPNGLFVAFTPNGSDVFRDKFPRLWHRSWGFVHATLIDDIYYDTHFQGATRLIATYPYDLDAIRSAHLAQREKTVLDLGGPELLFATRKWTSR